MHGLVTEIDLLTRSKKEHLRVAALEFVMSKMEEQAHFHWRGRASAGGNLNYERFRGIAAEVGIDDSRYETRSKSSTRASFNVETRSPTETGWT